MTDVKSITSTVKAAPGAGRAELERALLSGPKAFRTQLRYVLALSQLARPSAPLPPTSPPLPTLAQARLEALGQLNDVITPSQAQLLLRSAAALGHWTPRLALMASWGQHLPAAEARRLIVELIGQAEQVDAEARALLWFTLSPLLRRVGAAPSQSSPLLRLLLDAQAMKNTEARLRALIALSGRLPAEVATPALRRLLDDLAEARQDAVTAKAMEMLPPYLPRLLLDRLLEVADGIQQPNERARAYIALARSLPADFQERVRLAALSAIDRMENDDERADSLVSFTPCLEAVTISDHYPEVLERALTSAILINRRSARARVLVSFSPYLTPDLQGEALAAVHSLPNERERAVLLAQLAPSLPSNMLVASLAVAHTMREQDSRVHALSVLAHYVPESARAQTLLDVLAAASNLPQHYERVRALVSLVDILSDALRDQALTNALETARLIDNENARARALNLLGPHLPSRLQERALLVARELPSMEVRLNALMGLIGHLPPSLRAEVTRDLLDGARLMPVEYKRARVLANLASLIPTEALDELIGLGEALSDPLDRLQVAIACAQNLPTERRPPLILKAWHALRQVEDGYDRAAAIASLAPFLPEGARADLNSAILASIAEIEDEYDRASALALLVPLLSDQGSKRAELPDFSQALWQGFEAALSVPEPRARAATLAQGVATLSGAGDELAFQAWARLAPRLAYLPLPELVLCLTALVPLVREFAAEEGLRDLAALLGAR